MNRAEREADPGASFDGGYHLHAQELHRQRVAKTPERVQFAEMVFMGHGIKYQLKNPETGHFHCWRKSDGKLFQFYASTGKIQGHNRARGINAMIKILEENKNDR